MSRVAVVARDLIIATRIAEAAVAAGHEVDRVDAPAQLPPAESVKIAFVDWDARAPGWGAALAHWCSAAPESSRPRLIVFGPHTDLDAHRDAAAHGLGPMWARSKLVRSLARTLSAPLADG